MTTVNRKVVIDLESNEEVFHLEGHPCSLSAFSHVPTARSLPKDRTYFNSPKKPDKSTCVYDLVFAKEDDFDPKLHRSDRRHDKLYGLKTNEEENSKIIPSLTSSVYGHRLDKPIDKQDRSKVRIMLVGTEFYRRNGIDI